MNRTNRDALVTRYELLASLIPKLEKKLKGFPSGSLKICKVGNKIYHPDFTILRRSDRKEIYLEHCGKLDDPKYTKDNLPRINEYVLNGFGLGDKLFLSFESSTVPLDVRVIDKMIEEYFR